MSKKLILVVDDEDSIRASLSGIFEDEGYAVVLAASAEEASVKLSDDLPDLILLDIWLPGVDGLEFLKNIKATLPSVPVIMMTGHGTIETAVKATKLGAYDFIEKPLSYDSVLLAVQKALEVSHLKEENLLLKERVGLHKELIGNSKAMLELKEQINVVAPTDAWVLITGENGTGKELVAQTIHRLSKRSAHALVAVNCAAIPEELIESELFGHEKGAFTGATVMKKGKFDQANGSTLFLDEIGDMSLKTQAKVLRALQEQSFERVGGSKLIKVDVRILAATNKDIEAEISKGNFREDLYYRLNVIPIEVPSLRDRKEDIPLLLAAFVAEFAVKTNKRHITVEDDVINVLMEYEWPGNVRELCNLAERLVILCKADRVTLKDLPALYFKKATPVAFADTGKQPVLSVWPAWVDEDDFRAAKAMFEKEYLSKKLMENQWNISKTAEAVGIERRHLHRKIEQLGIERVVEG